MEAEHFDYAVIGAGIVGSCTAWHLAKRGKNVILLEQFHLPTIRGSSHGQSRLIRTCYKEKYFSSLMPDAFEQWNDIEQATKTRVFKNTKLLYLSSEDDKLNLIKENMDNYAPMKYKMGAAKEFLDPKFIKFPDNYKAILDCTAGALFAHKAVSAVQELVKKHGGIIRDGCPVTSIKNDGNDVMITTEKGKIRTGSLIVCAGAWTSKLFSAEINKTLQKYITPLAVRVHYWKVVKHPTSELFSFIDDDINSHAYGIFGSDEYPGLVKVCKHGGVPCDPNERDKAVFNPEMEKDMMNYIAERFPMLEPVPAVVESCMYTDAIDETCIIDKVPTYENIFVGCGFSGTGFKTAPVVGKLLCEMALGLPPSHNLGHFSLSRFQKIGLNVPI